MRRMFQEVKRLQTHGKASESPPAGVCLFPRLVVSFSPQPAKPSRYSYHPTPILVLIGRTGPDINNTLQPRQITTFTVRLVSHSAGYRLFQALRPVKQVTRATARPRQGQELQGCEIQPGYKGNLPFHKVTDRGPIHLILCGGGNSRGVRSI
jgi:hypothetical protein